MYIKLIYIIISKNLILSIKSNLSFNLSSCSEQSIWALSKGWSKFSSKLISDLYSVSVTSEKVGDSSKIAKFKSLHKKDFLIQLCNYRPISLLPLMFKVMEKVIHDETSTYLNSRNLL